MACAEPELCKEICGNSVGCTDTAYARLVMELLPVGEEQFPAPPPSAECPHTFMHLSNITPLYDLHSRAARFDDGCDDRCPHVLPDLHLQQLQHHFHHGLVEDFQIQCD